MDLANLIRDVPDFPIQGVMFKDITPLLQNAAGLRAAIDGLAERLRGIPADLVVGMESRGFIFAGWASCRPPRSASSTSSNTAPTALRCTTTASSPASGC
jgi:hypothetical protein